MPAKAGDEADVPATRRESARAGRVPLHDEVRRVARRRRGRRRARSGRCPREGRRRSARAGARRGCSGRLRSPAAPSRRARAAFVPGRLRNVALHGLLRRRIVRRAPVGRRVARVEKLRSAHARRVRRRAQAVHPGLRARRVGGVAGSPRRRCLRRPPARRFPARPPAPRRSCRRPCPCRRSRPRRRRTRADSTSATSWLTA